MSTPNPNTTRQLDATDFEMLADILTDVQIDLNTQANAQRFSPARKELQNAAEHVAELRSRLEFTKAAIIPNKAEGRTGTVE